MRWKRATTILWQKLGSIARSGSSSRFLFVCLLLITCATAQATPQSSDGYPRIWADAGSRLGPDGKPHLDVWLELCHDGLHFERVPDGYRARLELTLVAYDDDRRQAGGDSWRRELRVPTYSSTRSDTECTHETLSLELSPGLYTAAVAVTDRHTAERSRLVFPVRVGGIEAGEWHMSDLLFLGLSASPDTSSRPSQLIPRPATRRVYGEEFSAMMVEIELFTEAADGSFPPADLRAAYRIEDWRGNPVVEGEAATVGSFPGDASHPAWVRYMIRHPLKELGRGNYSLEVRCTGDDMGEAGLVRRENFQVSSSAAFWLRDFDRMVEMLRFAGSPEELKELKEAPETKRREKWEAFWNSRDPTPDTPRNEAEEEYFRRVNFANRHFGVFHREGWETDRGMIYILYGPPDDIDRLPEGPGGSMREIWYYHRENRRFYFVDESGFGDYRLRGDARP